MIYFNYNPYFCYRLQKVINYLKTGGLIPKGDGGYIATLPRYIAPSFGEGLVIGLKDFGKGIVQGLTRVGSVVGDIAGAAASRAAVLPGMLLYSLPVGKGSTITEQHAMNPYYGNLSDLSLEPTFRGYPLDRSIGAFGTVELPEVEVRPTMNAKTGTTKSSNTTKSSSTAGSSSATPNPEEEKKDKKKDEDKKKDNKTKKESKDITKGIKDFLTNDEIPGIQGMTEWNGIGKGIGWALRNPIKTGGAIWVGDKIYNWLKPDEKSSNNSVSQTTITQGGY